MKEKIFEILHNRKRMPGERFSDIEGKIEHLVNQEVEKRIAERMPNKRDTEQARTNVLQQYLVGNISLSDVVCQTELFYCSRLTNPGVNDSQKTEGGGE